MAHKILVVHLAGIGDLLMGLPALQALQTSFPASRLVLLVLSRSQDLARLISPIHEYYALDENRSVRAISHNISTIRRLRSMRFDLAINLYQVYRRIGVVKMAGLLRLLGPKSTAGRDTDGKGFCFDVRVAEHSSGRLHEVERQLAVVEQIAGYRGETAFSLPTDPRDAEVVEEWLRTCGVGPDEPLIGIHPGGSKPDHRWPWRSFAQVARELETRDSTRLVLTGSPDEEGLAGLVAAELERPLVAAGRLSLGQLACLLLKCRLFVANDSGPAHLAATLKVPLVAIMGPADPGRYGPYPLDRPDQLILHAEGCGQCHRDRCGGHLLLERLPAQAVLEAADAILSGEHPSGVVHVPPVL